MNRYQQFRERVLKVSVAAPKGHAVTEVGLPSGLKDGALHTLHDSYRLEMRTKQLVSVPTKTTSKRKRATPAAKKKK